MAEIGRFFDGPTYGAQEHAEFYQNFLSTGFFSGLNIVTSENMTVAVEPGSAFVEGHEYRNTSELLLTHAIASPTLDRIDRVIIRLDLAPDADRPLRAMVRSGLPASNPQPPELIRNGSIYELSLAQVRVIAGKSFIESHQITDERGNIDVCGRVYFPSKMTGQIDSIDVKGPSAIASDFADGFSRFYVSGAAQPSILQEWFNSLGVSPSDFGRNLDQLRVYVEVTANKTNTGIQTITIFDWTGSNQYKIYAVYKRASNSRTGATPWGKWHPQVFVVDEGENEYGHFIRYSNGVQECWCTPRGATVDVSSGSLFRSETETIPYPASFITSKPRHASVEVSSTLRWGAVTGTGGSNSIGVRQFSTISSSTEYSSRVYVTGWWR
ncbi:hypothetical protein [Halalkalibacter krulwichiae]|uniref:hypothetical protein n=1 Tax=Halalkalibacter krulwichiae TaxID=199441 RepID=UPI0008246350|nr:hypothetical protein [Halalkalibacter krulwichiae]